MCQAIVKPAGIHIFKKQMAMAWQANPDGAGFAWREADGSVHYQRGFFDFKLFWQAYREHQDKDVLIHLRFATHGSKCMENTHPFVVDEDCMMAHNGILSEFTDDKLRSDSRVFVEDVLQPACDAAGGWRNFLTPATIKLMDGLIGWNKLAFLTRDGFIIIGAERGEWTEKTGTGRVWWSSGRPTASGRQYSYGEYYAMSEDNWESEQGTLTVKSNTNLTVMRPTESTMKWDEFLKKKYGADKVQYSHGMAVGTPEDAAEFHPLTGAPTTSFETLPPSPMATENAMRYAIALTKSGQPIPEWVYKMDPNKPLTVEEVEDMIDARAELDMLNDDDLDLNEHGFIRDLDECDLRLRDMSEDEVIDFHIKNRGAEIG